MRTCVILNPLAGRPDSVDAVRGAISSISDLDLRTCTHPGEIEAMVRSAVTDGYRRIVAAGGDGTVSAVATTLTDLREEGDGLECGILPIGTGNDLALALGIPRRIPLAVELVRTGVSRPVDAIGCRKQGPGIEGQGRQRPSSSSRDLAWNAVVGGFGGGIADHLTPARKRRWRRYAYLRAAVTELSRLSPHELELVVDGRTRELSLLMLVVSSGSHAGGGIPFAPGARVDDGVLEIVGIRAAPIHALARLVPRVLSGRHLDAPGIVHFQGRTVTASADISFRFNRDGEDWTSGSARFEALPGVIPFVRP
jgi:diacylglycerol kinase (ATP)